MAGLQDRKIDRVTVAASRIVVLVADLADRIALDDERVAKRNAEVLKAYRAGQTSR